MPLLLNYWEFNRSTLLNPSNCSRCDMNYDVLYSVYDDDHMHHVHYEIMATHR